MLKYFLLASAILWVTTANAQITDRTRPSEWNDLVFGGRFMDRLLPIPVIGELKDSKDVWGSKSVIPRYPNNGIEDNLISYWGGNVIIGDDGKYHLYVCGWPETSPKGHMYWPKSNVYHAISNHPYGPYKVRSAIGKGHNPTIYKSKDGNYILYVIKAYYSSKSLYGPWEKHKFSFDKRNRKIIEGLSNVTFAQREDSSYLAICRGGGVWFSKTGETSYNQVTQERVYPDVQGNFEDPLVWRTNIQYHLIVNDWRGRIAWYLRSKDGVNWKVDPGEAYLPGITKYEDGTEENWYKYERIRILQDKYGRATQAHFAVIDTIKHNDLEFDNHSSKHIVIPLTVGKLISVLNNDPINNKTKRIEVKVEAEPNFNPHTDIDLKSLKFGASEKVNFGYGSELIDTQKSGKDLILIFNGKGNGFTNDNFAGKLLGKTTDGKLLFGYSRLPGVSYLDPILSARQPTLNSSDHEITVAIENFGQVNSSESEVIIELTDGNKRVKVKGAIPPLKPFEKTEVILKTKEPVSNTAKDVTVIINSTDLKPIIFNTSFSK